MCGLDLDYSVRGWERRYRVDVVAVLRNEPEKATLTALPRTHGEIVGISERDGFCYGFRLGALAMLDILCGAE